MRDITRTITTTFIRTAHVSIVNGNAETKINPDIVIIGDVSDSKCSKIAAKQYPGAAVIGIERTDKLYAISPEDFVKYGHPAKDKPEQIADGMPTPENA